MLCVCVCLLPCVCAICPSVCECEVESVHIPASVFVCQRGKYKASPRPACMCEWMWVSVTVCVHTFVYVWVWRAVLAHTDLCHEEDAFLNYYSAFASWFSPQINLHTVISPSYCTRLLSRGKSAQIKCTVTLYISLVEKGTKAAEYCSNII